MLAPNMENRPAYLSGREEDIMAYLYGDQASEMVRRVKRHAGHYQSQCGQGGGGGGESDGGDDPHGDDDDGRNEHPGNRHGGGGPPSGNRNGPFLGRGGQPPHGLPGPPGGPPSDLSAHQSDSSNHPSETDCRNNNSNNHGEHPNYLRGYTPGKDRYIELAMRRYSQRIDKQVDKEPDGPLGPKVKAMNPPKPKKYVGEDDINKFDEWLVQLLAYFRIFKITGLRTNTTCVQYTGLYLSKLAQQWYSQEVHALTRHIRHWTFEDLIFGLFRRFIHEASAQNAAIQYNRTKYSADKGVLAFYNELTRRVDCMVEPPDSYLFRRKYLGGLPQTIVKMVLEARGISAEHSSIEEILNEVKRVESAQKALNLYTKQSAQAGGGRSPMQHVNSEPTEGQKDRGNSTSK